MAACTCDESHAYRLFSHPAKHNGRLVVTVEGRGERRGPLFMDTDAGFTREQRARDGGGPFLIAREKMKSVTDELVWFDGLVMPLAQARIGLEDRGFNFADGVYEVIRFYRGQTFTLKEHLDRLERSAREIYLQIPLGMEHLADEIRKLISLSHIAEGMIYLQLTRGQSPRQHPFPKDTKPTLFFYCRPVAAAWSPGEGEGCSVISAKDERWHRCYIKSLALLPNVLAKNQAISAGHDEAVFIHNGKVTECSASNIFCVRNGAVYSCPVGEKVLPGITRLVITRIAKRLGIPFHDEALSLEEALKSDEVFITSTTRELGWVRVWDGKTIGNGQCGAITRKLHEAYVEEVEAETGVDVAAA